MWYSISVHMAFKEIRSPNHLFSYPRCGCPLGRLRLLSALIPSVYAGGIFLLQNCSKIVAKNVVGSGMGTN